LFCGDNVLDHRKPSWLAVERATRHSVPNACAPTVSNDCRVTAKPALDAAA